MNRADRIRAALEAKFDVQEIEIIDESEQHRGHAGFQDGGESHFRLRIRAPQFAGLSRLARHRAVHGAIGSELMAEIHALSLDIGDGLR